MENEKLHSPRPLDLYSGNGTLNFLGEQMKMNAHSINIVSEYKETHNYYKNRICLGLDEVGEPVLINLHKARHILILGNTGAGKSFILRGLWNRFVNAGGSVAIPTDTKPEYAFSANPIQQKFRRFLRRNEEPRGYPVKTYRPYFLSRITNIPVAKHEIPCQISLTDITQNDLYTILGISELTDQKKVVIDTTFQKVKDGDIWSIEDMCKEIEKDNDVAPVTKKSIINLLRNVERFGVIGDSSEKIDFVNDLNEGKVPTMNLKGGLGTGRYDNYANAYIAVLMRQMLDAKAEGKFPQSQHLMIILDEINRYCPASGEGVAKSEILRALDTFRQERGIMCFTTQDITRVPSTILEQCRYVLIGHNVKPESAKYVIKQKAPQEVDHPVVFDQEISFLMGSLKQHRDESRDWVFIDDQSKDRPTVLRPLAPLSATREEGE